MAFGIGGGVTALGLTAWLIHLHPPACDARTALQVAAVTIVFLAFLAGAFAVLQRRWIEAAAAALLGPLAALALFVLIETTPKPAPPPPPPPRAAILLPWVRIWPGGVVPVCWVNRPDRTAARIDDLRMILAVKQAEETWSNAGAVSFHDLGVCPSDFHGVRLFINRSINDADAPTLGFAISDQNQPVGLPFVFPSRSGCSTSGRFGGADQCTYGEAVHELGHALGLPDIHYSRLAPDACRQTLRQDHPVQDIPYDAASVMNACNPDHLRGQLSVGDVQAVRQIYGP